MERGEWRTPDDRIMQIARDQAAKIIISHENAGIEINHSLLMDLMLGFVSECVEWVGEFVGEEEAVEMNSDLIKALGTVSQKRDMVN